MPEKIMKGTALASLACTIMFIAFYKIYGGDVFFALAVTGGTICYHVTMRLAVGQCLNQFIRHPLDHHAKWFTARPFEKRLYEKLGVKRWKHKVPTYDPDSFSMEHHTIEEVIQTMCIAEIGHEIMILFSYLTLLFSIPFGAFFVFLLTAVLAGGVDTVFVVIQRYNRPRLVRIADRRDRKKHMA